MGITGTVRVGNMVKPMHSLLQNFMYLLNAALQKTVNVNVVDTGNVVRSCGGWNQTGTQYGWSYNAGVAGVQPAAGISAYGIQVGSNATAVVITDYKLNTQIAQGTGAGQMKYSGQSFIGNLSSGNNRFVRISRYFTNDSGGDVTIREVGLAVTPQVSYGGPVNVLIARDLTGDIVVSNTNAVPVELTIQISL